MATRSLDSFSGRLRRTVFPRDGGSLTDAQLLECFRDQRDEAAFAALLRRHGPMVLGVCRRVLGHVHDAEDAFQATFLVLVRRAASLAQPERLGPWLYGVAHRTALAARSRRGRRSCREEPVEDLAAPASALDPDLRELTRLLDQEMTRLPEKYRVPLVLCHLESHTRAEAARLLKLPEGTLSSRLATARRLLARRLARRGVTVSGAALAVTLAQQALAASVSLELVTSTSKAATLVAAGSAAGAGVVTPEVVALTNGVIQAMFLNKLTSVLAVVLTVILTTAGAGVLTRQALADRPATLVAAADADQQDTGKPSQEKRKRAEPEKVMLTGKVTKKDEERKTDDGGTRTVTIYTLTESNGNKVALPLPRRNEAGDLLDDYNLDDFVEKTVVIAGRALTARVSERPNATRKVTRLLAISDIKVKK